ncbi:MAG: hypothetical protein SH809_19560 [Rhodothermales bacterium]|nr:hypothetical protein [Rhodothermales bacterium]
MVDSPKDPPSDSRLQRTGRLVPFLLAIGPLWIALFAHSELLALRLAAVLGALALGLGLILMLARLHSLEEKVARLDDARPASTPQRGGRETSD